MSTGLTLPNLLVLGSAKCATTSLHYYLNQHPDIYMASKKECHFFCHQDIPSLLYEERYRPIDSIDRYSKLFEPGASSEVRGESSPMYLFYEATAARIKAEVPDVRMIAILRNPADRAFSAYLHSVRDGIEDLPFDEAIEAEADRMASCDYSATHAYLEFGSYYRKLKPYFDCFDRDQIRVFAYEDVTEDMPKVLREACSFLGVDPGFSFDTRPRLNVSGVPRRPWIQRLAQAAAADRGLFKWIKRPIPESAWIRIVKSVQHSNYERPEMTSAQRSAVLVRFAEDIDQLSVLLDRDFAALWNSPKNHSTIH